jgi:hypothetical protein
MHSKKENTKSVRLTISEQDKKKHDDLINDIQNLIWALGFETGPKPKGRIDNLALVFFALIEQAFLEPLPWQKIHVATGPKDFAMYHVLQAAISAIKVLNPGILYKAKLVNAGKYDLIETLLDKLVGGERSIHDGGYVKIANTFGTITSQPGYLVNELIKQTEQLIGKYVPVENYLKFLFFAGKNGMPREVRDIITERFIEKDSALNCSTKKPIFYS